MHPKYTFHFSGILLLSFFCLHLPAQNLIPFLGANGQYGFANASGKVLTPPQFQKAWLPNAQGMALAVTENDQLHLIRDDGTVLPATVPISKWGAPAVEPVINYSADGTLLDTLPNLWCLRSASNKEYLLVKNGKYGWESSTYQHYEALKSTVQIFGSYFNENYIGPMTFTQGLHRVIKGERKVNFINSNGNEIFPNDYENGAILKNGYLSLASSEDLFALASPQGKLLTPFIFRNIIGTPRPGYFAINYKPAQSTITAGLMREDGSLAIDTVYEELIGVTGEWIIARKGYQYGLLNYEGDTLLPFQYFSLDYAEKTYFIATDNTDKNIIDISGKLQLKKNWPKIRFVKSYSEQNPDFYELAEGGKSKLTAILDTNLQQIFVDSIRELSLRGTHFLITQAGNTQVVYDYTGKQLIPPIYQTIEQLRYCGGYLVEKDSLFGVYTSDGRVELPCKYTKIVQEVTGSSCILWANTQKNKNQFTPFTLEGERLPIADQIMPTLRALELKNCFAVEMEKGQWKLILPDGSWVYKSLEYSQGIINLGTPEGCLLVEKGKETCEVLDPYLKSILPKGFTLPTDRYRGPYLQMGLIPVYQGAQSGIIDTRGKWVKKPGPFQYHILRPNIYSEHIGQPQEHNLQGAAIYTIAPGGTQKVEVDYLNDKFRDNYLVVGRFFDDAPAELLDRHSYAGKLLKYALMDTLGQLLTPFHFAQYPQPRGGRWYSEVYTADYQVKKVVLDEKGTIVFDFGDEPVSGYDPERHWVYLTDPNNYTGIRDTLGREILPVQYREIQWPLPGKFFTSHLPDGSRQLCTLDGKVLLSGISYVSECRELPGGNLLVIDNQRAHIFKPDLQILCSTPAGREAELVEEYPDLLRLKAGDGYKWVYLNFRTGVVFGAK